MVRNNAITHSDLSSFTKDKVTCRIIRMKDKTILRHLANLERVLPKRVQESWTPLLVAAWSHFLILASKAYFLT